MRHCDLSRGVKDWLAGYCFMLTSLGDEHSCISCRESIEGLRSGVSNEKL